MSEVDQQAQQIVDVAAAEHHADVVAAFWHRLKDNGILPAERHEFTLQQFWPTTYSYHDFDDEEPT